MNAAPAMYRRALHAPGRLNAASLITEISVKVFIDSVIIKQNLSGGIRMNNNFDPKLIVHPLNQICSELKRIRELLEKIIKDNEEKKNE